MDFEGEYTIRTASNQQTYEPNTVYPDAVLNIARESASVFQLKRKWEKTPPMLNLTPDFQRGLVWKTKQKSELIESILMGIPLPLIYVKEDEKEPYFKKICSICCLTSMYVSPASGAQQRLNLEQSSMISSG